MTIVPSRSADIQNLVAGLGSKSEVRRDSAVARLTLLGARATPAVVAALESPEQRLAALSVLENLSDPASLPAILSLTLDPEEPIALRAIEVAAGFPRKECVKALRASLRRDAARRAAAEGLARLLRAGVLEALDPLVALAVEEDSPKEPRLVAIAALAASEPGTFRRLRPRLLKSAEAAVVRAVSSEASLEGSGQHAVEALLDALILDPASRAEATIEQLVRIGTGALPQIQAAALRTQKGEAAMALVEVLGRVADPSSVPVLHRLLRSLEGERSAPVHLALARLQSRIALDDLRERLEARPLRDRDLLLEAVALVGDGRHVPALARLASEEPRSRRSCATALASLVSRGGSRRASLKKGVRPEDLPALETIWPKARKAP